MSSSSSRCQMQRVSRWEKERPRQEEDGKVVGFTSKESLWLVGEVRIEVSKVLFAVASRFSRRSGGARYYTCRRAGGLSGPCTVCSVHSGECEQANCARSHAPMATKADKEQTPSAC